jgi:hypothetical protein
MGPACPFSRPPPCRDDPKTPRQEEVEQPGTPDDAFMDLFASWMDHLPSIRVVGRGFEDRRHGGSAALCMLNAARNSGRGSSPFQFYMVEQTVEFEAEADVASGGATPAATVPAARRANSAPMPAAPVAAAAAKRPPRQLAAQDSASSMELMGAGVQRLSMDSLASPTCASPCTQLLGSLPEEDHLAAAAATRAWAHGAPGASGLVRGLDISGRVHGSCSFSDLYQAAALAAATLQAAPSEAGPPEGQASPGTGMSRKLAAASPGRRIARLDSGLLGGLMCEYP